MLTLELFTWLEAMFFQLFHYEFILPLPFLHYALWKKASVDSSCIESRELCSTSSSTGQLRNKCTFSPFVFIQSLIYISMYSQIFILYFGL
jgi:hypothetical protein